MEKTFQRSRRVLLIMLPEKMSRTEYPWLGILYLSSMLKKDNIKHDILDLRLYKNWQKKLIKNIGKYGIIGISCTTPEAHFLKSVSRIIKDFNNRSVTVVGGPHATILAETILKDNQNIDCCLRGDGEYNFIDLINKKPLKYIDGLTYRSKNKIISNKIKYIQDLDKLPFPNYDKINMDDYLLLPRTFRIITSRGCPFQCTYCSKNLGVKFRPRSEKNVVDEIEFLKKKYKVKYIRFIDDNFSLDLERAKNICREILRRNLDIKWWCPNGTRVDRLDRELLSLMKKSGCTMITLGIESINNEVLKRYKKNLTKEKIIEIINMIKEFNIPIEGFFMISGISETKQDVLDYLEFAKKYDLKNICFSMLIPLPKSEVYEWITKNGYWEVKDPLKAISNEVSAIQFAFENKNIRALFSTPEMSVKEKEEIYKYVQKDWAQYLSKKSLVNRIAYYCRKFHFNFVFDLFDKFPLLMKLLKKMT